VSARRQGAKPKAARRLSIASVHRLSEAAATETVFALDADLAIAHLSPPARHLLGIQPERRLRTPFTDAVPEEDRDTVTAWLRDLRARGALLVHRLRRADGGILWVETRARRATLVGAPSVRIQGSMRDISEHKHFEMQVERVAQQWRATVDATGDAILMLDTAGRVMRLNLAAARLCGLDFAHVLDRQVGELLRAALGVELEDGVAAVTTSGEKYETDLYVKRRRTWLAAQISPMRDRAGELTGAVLVLSDISARKKAEARLSHSHEQLRRVSTHLEQASEQSRKELAREIHDELGHLLTALKMDLAWIETKLGREEAALLERARAAVAVSDQAIAAVRRISAELHPSVLDSLGLPAAIEWHCRELKRRSGMDVTVDVPTAELDLEPVAATALFRILQEATTNVLRHAQAKHLRVRLWSERGAVWLRIEDDGRGFRQRSFDPARGFGLGLFGMQERGEMIGARVVIRSRPGRGTVVTVQRRPAD